MKENCEIYCFDITSTEIKKKFEFVNYGSPVGLEMDEQSDQIAIYFKNGNISFYSVFDL